MPVKGKIWRHVIVSSLGSWLPGDRRGWRSRGRKVHSSGDYHQPPPATEHTGLRGYMQAVSGSKVIIDRQNWPTIGRAILDELAEQGHRCLVISVSATHCHFLAEMPIQPGQTKLDVGRCKRLSSKAVRSALPGRVWARGGKFDPIHDRRRHRNTFNYIKYEQGPAWVWAYDGLEGYVD